MNTTLKIEIDDNAQIVTVEGIKISVAAARFFLNHPPRNRLFSFRRDGDDLIVSTITNAEDASQFFRNSRVEIIGPSESGDDYFSVVRPTGEIVQTNFRSELEARDWAIQQGYEIDE